MLKFKYKSVVPYQIISAQDLPLDVLCKIVPVISGLRYRNTLQICYVRRIRCGWEGYDKNKQRYGTYWARGIPSADMIRYIPEYKVLSQEQI